MSGYYFETQSGKRVTVDIPSGTGPDIGEWGWVKGRMLKRLPSGQSTRLEVSVESNYEITNFTCSTEHPSIDALGLPRDEYGHPKFSGIRQIRQFNADSQRQHERDPNVAAFGWDL